MKNILIAVMICLTCMQVAWAETNKAESDAYKIGVIISLSGRGATLGGYVKKGIDLAYNSLSAEQKKKIQLFYEDDRFLPANAVSAYQKLRSLNQIDAVFVMGSGIGNAIAPLAEKHKLLAIGIGASDFNIVKDKHFVFTHWVTPEVEAQALVAELKRRAYKNLAFITQEHEGAIAMYNAIKAEVVAQGLEKRLVLDELFLPDHHDFNTYITKAKARKVDGIIVMLFPGSIAAFAKQAKAMGLKAEFAGVELFEDENEVKASDGALVGHWYVNADEATGKFIEEYKNTYSQHPGWGAANAYDTLMLIAQAIEQEGLDTEKIVTYLNKVKDHNGAAGIYSASGDNRFNLPATVKVVRKDGFEKLG